MRNDIIYYGITEGQGQVVSFTNDGLFNKLIIDSSLFPEPLKSGEQVAVNGVCLTLQSINDYLLIFHLWPTTLEKTNLGQLKPGTSVNLERNRYSR